MELAPRIKNILSNPKDEWQAVESETPTTKELYASYIAPLAAIGPVASIIGMSIIGVRMPSAETFRVPFGTALVHGIVS